MKNTKHTPGEWEVDYNYSPKQDEYREIRANEILLARVFNENWGNLFKEEAEANARLIAAAPELLEALKQFIHSVEHEGVISGRVVDAVREARAAIQKATISK